MCESEAYIGNNNQNISCSGIARIFNSHYIDSYSTIEQLIKNDNEMPFDLDLKSF